MGRDTGIGLAALLLLLALPIMAPAQDNSRAPIKVVGAARVQVGDGQIPLFSTADWQQPHPEIDRAVLVIHGLLRNADVYFKTAIAAQRDAGPDGAHSLMLAPQFIDDEDVAAWNLGPEMLRWGRSQWAGGEPAHGRLATSSFAAIDAILARLADPQFYPNLRNVVVAGHSAGGQVVQRYAVVGNGDAALVARGIFVRYVIANPSSYLYFSAERPVAPEPSCANVNRWKYGFDGDTPPYVDQSPAFYQQRYAARQVIYLLGTADIDPHHSALDVSCAAEAQGANRYARGLAYLRYLRARTGAAMVHLHYDVPGVGHDGDAMFTSTCGLAALFDKQGCAAIE